MAGLQQLPCKRGRAQNEAAQTSSGTGVGMSWRSLF
jgi:hypothetical protein